MSKLTGHALVLAVLCGLQGCGGTGPSAGMPDQIPDGPPKTMPTTPISTKDFQKARTQAVKAAKDGKAAEAAAPAAEAPTP